MFVFYRIKSKRIPDDILPPRSQIASNLIARTDLNNEAAKKRAKKRKLANPITKPLSESQSVVNETIVHEVVAPAPPMVLPTSSNNLMTMLDNGKILLVDNDQQVIELTSEQARQFVIHPT